RVELTLDGLEERLDTDLETLVFRLVQEALTNVLRHAGADCATVAVSRGDTLLALQIADRGKGFDTGALLVEGEAATGSGLRGMRDRLELFGGRPAITSEPGERTLAPATGPALAGP